MSEKNFTFYRDRWKHIFKHIITAFMDFSDKNKAFAWKRKNTIFTFLFRLSMKNAPFFNFPI